jgi:hypothetical protein
MAHKGAPVSKGKGKGYIGVWLQGRLTVSDSSIPLSSSSKHLMSSTQATLRERNAFKCPHKPCKTKHRHPSQLRDHCTPVHANLTPYKCCAPGCSATFGWISQAYKHIKDMASDENHKGNIDVKKDPIPLCKVCEDFLAGLATERLATSASVMFGSHGSSWSFVDATFYTETSPHPFR